MEKLSLKGWEAAVAPPARPKPPEAVGLDLDDLTVDGLVDQVEIAGLVMFWPGVEGAPRDGKASSEEVSTAVDVEVEPLPLPVTFDETV